MLWYTVKRMLWSVPTVLVITLLGFVLLSAAPGDPADHFVTQNSSGGQAGATAQINALKKQWRHRLGLDLPLFYVSLSKWSLPDTVYKISDPGLKKAYLALMDYSGNKAAVTLYYQRIDQASRQFNVLQQSDTVSLSAAQAKAFQEIRHHLDLLPFQTSDATINTILHDDSILANAFATGSNAQSSIAGIAAAFRSMQTHRTVYKNYIPKVSFYGLNNQYHHWLFGGIQSKGLLHGDFGLSYVKKIPVMEIIEDKLPWSLFFSLASVILAYVISIPLGLKMARKPASAFTKRTSYLLFLLYAMPPFFMGVLLLMLFANPGVAAIFPPSGIKPLGGYESSDGFFDRFLASLPCIVLPLICYTYSSLAFLTRLTAASVRQQLPLDYIKTARAKGLDDKTVTGKHALKNALLPLVTVFANIFPALLGGSVIIETIFTIPGMGAETVKAVYAQDYPLVMAILTLSGILTVAGYLLSDLLYAWIDPRIRLERK